VAAIVAEKLTKVFNGFKAVDEVSFEVKESEIFGFLGPNGAGKTTTINMLITLMKPTSGHALVAGYDVVKEPEKVRGKIGVVFQDQSIDRELTGWENLWLHGLVYGVPRSTLRQRIRQLLKLVELEGFANTPVKKYSGGMIRRLEIARALIHRPEILFLDEPTLGLDPQSRAKIWDYILDLRKEHGMTIFLTTHYIEEAERLCDRVAIIDHGKIIALGSPEELKQSIGGELIYLKVSENPSLYSAFLEKLSDIQGVLSVKTLGNRQLSLRVKSASTTIPAIFDLAQAAGVKISEIKYTKPSLNDVFLQLTGRALRDEEASWRDHARLRTQARWRR